MLFQLLCSFFKIGLFSLGGGNTLIKLIEDEFVDRLNILTIAEYGELVGVSFAFPGLSAIKIAALIGYKCGGFIGLCVSVLALNIPGIVLCLIFFQIISQYKHLNIVQKLFDGMRYVAIVCIFSAGISLLSPLAQNISFKAVVLPLTALFLLNYFGLSLILVILAFLCVWIIV